MCSAILVSGSVCSNVRATNLLVACSAILVSDSVVLLKYRSNSLAGCVKQFLSAVLMCLLNKELLTCWMGVHSFQLFWSAQSGDKTHFLDACSAIFMSGSNLLKHWRANSHPGCMFSHSCQWFWSAQNWRANSLPGWIKKMFSDSGLLKHRRANSLSGWMFNHSSQWFWSAKTLGSELTLWICVFNHSCQWSWSAQIPESELTRWICV